MKDFKMKDLVTADNGETIMDSMTLFNEWWNKGPKSYEFIRLSGLEPDVQLSKPGLYPIKLRIFGDEYTGKSCLILRLRDASYTESYVTHRITTTSITINVNNANKDQAKLSIFEEKNEYTDAEMNKLFSPNKGYYGYHACLITVDVTNRDSFKNLSKWINQLTAQGVKREQIVLVATKIDLTSKRDVSSNELKEFADAAGIQCLYEVSAKMDFNNEEVTAVFRNIATSIINRIEAKVEKPDPNAKKQLEAQLKSFTNALDELFIKAIQLKHRGDSGAGKLMWDLAVHLKTKKDNFVEAISNTQELDKTVDNFKAECQVLLDAAKPKLGEHRNIRYILANIGLMIAGLGVGYAVASIVHKVKYGSFLFFDQTDSSKKVKGVEKNLQEFKDIRFRRSA